MFTKSLLLDFPFCEKVRRTVITCTSLVPSCIALSTEANPSSHFLSARSAPAQQKLVQEGFVEKDAFSRCLLSGTGVHAIIWF